MGRHRQRLSLAGDCSTIVRPAISRSFPARRPRPVGVPGPSCSPAGARAGPPPRASQLAHVALALLGRTRRGGSRACRSTARTHSARTTRVQPSIFDHPFARAKRGWHENEKSYRDADRPSVNLLVQKRSRVNESRLWMGVCCIAASRSVRSLLCGGRGSGLAEGPQLQASDHFTRDEERCLSDPAAAHGRHTLRVNAEPPELERVCAASAKRASRRARAPRRHDRPAPDGRASGSRRDAGHVAHDDSRSDTECARQVRHRRRLMHGPVAGAAAHEEQGGVALRHERTRGGDPIREAA